MLKYILVSKKLSSNWLFIVKKIIHYSHIKSKNINQIIPDKKDIKNNLENIRCLHFLNDYNPFFIKKFL